MNVVIATCKEERNRLINAGRRHPSNQLRIVARSMLERLATIILRRAIAAAERDYARSQARNRAL
jgi:hypothetical protein